MTSTPSFEPTRFIGIVVTKSSTGEVKVSDVFCYPSKECARDTLDDSVMAAHVNGFEIVDAPLWDADDDGNACSDYNAKNLPETDPLDEAERQALFEHLNQPLVISDEGLDALRTVQKLTDRQPDNWRPGA